jgi:CDP-glucose 4,6-dehydratase
VFQSTYSGKAVLVTGHTGFKGAWLSIWLLRLGARVVGYSLEPPTTPCLFESSGLAAFLQDVRGDIRDTEKLARVIGETRPDFIFHLAAAPLVLDSYTNPFETFDVNVMGTPSVLEAVRRSGSMCSMIAVSTDKCYANREWEYGYREHDPLGGRDPYSASKAAMEIAVASFRASFFSPNSSANAGVRVASARAGNVLGGGDWASNRIVPDIVPAFHAYEVLSVRSPRADQAVATRSRTIIGVYGIGGGAGQFRRREVCFSLEFWSEPSRRLHCYRSGGNNCSCLGLRRMAGKHRFRCAARSGPAAPQHR